MTTSAWIKRIQQVRALGSIDSSRGDVWETFPPLPVAPAPKPTPERLCTRPGCRQKRPRGAIRFCSRRCKAQSTDRRVTRLCPCGVTFRAQEYTVAHGGGKYHSRPCYDRFGHPRQFSRSAA